MYPSILINSFLSKSGRKSKKQTGDKIQIKLQYLLMNVQSTAEEYFDLRINNRTPQFNQQQQRASFSRKNAKVYKNNYGKLKRSSENRRIKIFQIVSKVLKIKFRKRNRLKSKNMILIIEKNKNVFSKLIMNKLYKTFQMLKSFKRLDFIKANILQLPLSQNHTNQFILPIIIVSLRMVKHRRNIISMYYSLRSSLLPEGLAFGFLFQSDGLQLVKTMLKFVLDKYNSVNHRKAALALFCVNFLVPGLKEQFLEEVQELKEERQSMRSVFVLDPDQHYRDQCLENVTPAEEQQTEEGFRVLYSNSSITANEVNQRLNRFHLQGESMITKAENNLYVRFFDPGEADFIYNQEDRWPFGGQWMEEEVRQSSQQETMIDDQSERSITTVFETEITTVFESEQLSQKDGVLKG